MQRIGWQTLAQPTIAPDEKRCSRPSLRSLLARIGHGTRVGTLRSSVMTNRRGPDAMLAGTILWSKATAQLPTLRYCSTLSVHR